MAKNGKLTRATEAWIRQVEGDFQLESHQKMLLRLAAEAWERSRNAREAIERDGTYVRSARGILAAHPAVRVEREAVKSFSELVKQLDLEDELGADMTDVIYKRKR
jgi:phage terminase small subunit